MNKYLLLLSLAILSTFSGFAQDAGFTQYYAAPLYLNPAFAGTTQQHRASVNYRNHWASLPNAFVTYAFSYDYNIKGSNSNVGLVVSTDKAGTASLRSTNIGAIYSYSIPLNNKIRFMPAFQVGYASQSIDFSQLVFPDQIQFGNSGAPTSDPSLRNTNGVSHFDFGTGFLLYDNKRWFGVSAKHLNQPNQTVIEGESRLPVHYSVHAGWKIPVKMGPMRSGISSSINPSFNYRQQGKYNQLDIGANYYYRMLMLGLWYRGLPLQRDMPQTINHDAISVAIGLSMSNLIFAYSYDMTISKLNPTASGGSHEVGLILHMQTAKRPGKVNRKDKYNPCPAFMPSYLWKP